MSQLRVIVDGEPLAEPEARALWQRFSTHMDEHQGDFEGFARSEGCASASVAVAGGVPTLTLVSSEIAEKPAKSPEGEPPGRQRPEPKGKPPKGKPPKGKPPKGKPRGRRKHQAPRRQADPDGGEGGTSPPRRRGDKR